MFEENWHVRWVQLPANSMSPMGQGKQQTHKPLDMTFRYVRDTSREGEFFL